jgi:membrane-bound lytic murein transglycosylase D
VRKGDTLVTIADRFGVSLSQLRRWNKMTGIKVEPGSRLHVAEPVVAQRVSSTHRRRSSTAGAGTTPHTATTAKTPAKTLGTTKSTGSKSSVSKSTGSKSTARRPVAKKKPSTQK